MALSVWYWLLTVESQGTPSNAAATHTCSCTQYNFSGILSELDKVVEAAVSKGWTFEPDKPGYVVK
jgi:hypothetical protein